MPESYRKKEDEAEKRRKEAEFKRALEMFEYKTVEFIGSHNYPLTMADSLDVYLKQTIPDPFNIDNFAMTVKKFDNIMKPDEFWQI